MKVNPLEGRCRRCGGPLEIVHIDDLFMEVACEECDEGYQVEPNAFGDGPLVYFLDQMAARQTARRDAGDEGPF